MFYADFVLSKKGPLSKVWLAAHWEKKLSKAQIFETDVNEAVNEIMRPSQNLALRTTGHLLLGICRVYSRKTKYLLADCNEAFLKIKLVFRNGALDEPNPVIPTFNMQDLYGEFGDNILPEFDEEDMHHAPICQSRIDDITMKEEIPQQSNFNYSDLLEDDDFGEAAAGVGPEDYDNMMRECEMMMEVERKEQAEKKEREDREREQTPAFGGDGSVSGNTSYDDDFHSGNEHHDDEEENEHDVQSSSGYTDNNAVYNDDFDYPDNTMMDSTEMSSGSPAHDDSSYQDDSSSFKRPASPALSVAGSVAQSTAGTAVEEDTIEFYYQQQAQKRALAKEIKERKRRIDDVRMITGEEMKSNMADFSDILTRLDLAPPTRKLMLGKRRSHAEYLMHYPGMIGFSRNKGFIRMYQENLIVTKAEDIEEKQEKVKNSLGLWDIGEEDMQLQQQEMDSHVQDDPQYDDFDDTPLEFDNFDIMEMPQSLDDLGMQDDDNISVHNPTSPFSSGMADNDDDDESPDGKRMKLMDDRDELEGDEDNKWSKRTHALLQTIAGKLSSHNQVELDDLLKRGISRKVAASKFYSLLCLKKNQCIDVEQKTAFGEIVIRRGPNIDVASI